MNPTQKQFSLNAERPESKSLSVVRRPRCFVNDWKLLLIESKPTTKMNSLRDELVGVALKWQKAYGNSPSITGILAEYDAAREVGCSEVDYQCQMNNRSAVHPDFDFCHKEKHYQVKSARPSGKKNSKVTFARKPKNYNWDYYIWVCYNTDFSIKEMWLWKVKDFKKRFCTTKRLSLKEIRNGEMLLGEKSCLDQK